MNEIENHYRIFASYQEVVSELRMFYFADADADFDEMIQHALDLIIAKFGFYMAWYAELDEEKKLIVPRLWSGKYEKYLDGLQLEYENDKMDAKCAMSISILTKNPFGYADLEHDKDFEKWRDFALQYGYRSNQAIPLVIDGVCTRSILIYSTQPRAFSDKIIEYLEGIVDEVSSIIKNVSIRKKTEEALHNERALRVSEEKFRILAEQSPNMIFILQGTKVVYANKQCEEIMGYSISEVCNPDFDFFRCVEKEYLPHIKERFTRHLKGEHVKPGEYALITKDGKRIEVLTSVRAITFNGTPTLIGTIVDITEQKQAEAEQEKMKSQLYEVQKMEAIGKLAGGIAHDFNNVITGILGMTETAMLQIDSESETYADLQEVFNCAGRAAELTRQLLLFSRRQPATLRLMHVNKVITDLNRMLDRLLGEDIVIHTDLNDGARPVIADRTQIEQVIINLAINAKDAMPKGGLLSIETRNKTLTASEASNIMDGKPGEYVCISVSDTGFGIRKEDLSRLFEPFFSTKGENRGTGLGLAVVYGIIQQHSGFIDVKSTVGKRTVFDVYIPASTRNISLLRPDSMIPRAVPRGNGETVLVVEDEEIVRIFISRTLSESGYNVMEMGTYTDGLASITKKYKDINAVFTDVVLPDGNGLDLVDILLKKHPDIPVLLTSGYLDEKANISLINEMNIPFLEKPYGRNQLLQGIRQVLDGTFIGKNCS